MLCQSHIQPASDITTTNAEKHTCLLSMYVLLPYPILVLDYEYNYKALYSLRILRSNMRIYYKGMKIK